MFIQPSINKFFMIVIQLYIAQNMRLFPFGQRFNIACIRFKKLDQIPYQLIGELATKIPPERWINDYEQQLKK
jgi:hypothetical protein